MLRLFTQFDTAAHKIELVEFFAIDAPGVADGIARKQISIVKRDNGMDDNITGVTGEMTKTYGSRRLNRRRKSK